VRYRSLLKVLVFVFSIAFFSNCTKIKGTDIGAGLLPAIDNVITFDTTFEVVASTYLTPDSLFPRLGRDINGNAGQFILGHISNNPQFGKTTASIFLELKPSNYPLYFETVADSLYLDSAVLCLRWTNTFGDTNALQTINVHRISEKLNSDSAYLTNKSVRYGELIGTKTFAPSVLNDSLFLFRQNLSNQLRIKLNNSFARALLSFDTTGVSPYKSDSLYREFLKGFALVPQTSGSNANALMSFAMSDTATQLRLYYRYTKGGIADTTFKNFIFNNGIPGASANQIVRNYAGSETPVHLGTKPRGDSLVYLQSAPGTYSMLKIPGLDQFKQKKGNVMIHLAQLSMQEVSTPGRRPSIFQTPDFLYVEMFDSTNKKYYPFISDGFINGKFEPLLFGGQRKYFSDNSGQFLSAYNMNLTRYLQGIITRNNPNFQLRLTAPYSLRYEDLFITFALNNLCKGDVVLGGGNHSSKKMKFRVVYSKL
jgi:hypothetical protein